MMTVPPVIPERKRKERPFCENCLTKRVKRAGRQCCSSECAAEFRRASSYLEIERTNGMSADIRLIKSYLISKYGTTCSMCGGDEWMKLPMPLVIDHINGRASDNRLENLRFVCGNCDMQLPTYKSKNKNSDRKR